MASPVVLRAVLENNTETGLNIFSSIGERVASHLLTSLNLYEN